MDFPTARQTTLNGDVQSIQSDLISTAQRSLDISSDPYALFIPPSADARGLFTPDGTLDD